MATPEKEDCWLIGKEGTSCGSFATIDSILPNSAETYDGPILPEDEKLLKEHQALEEKVKEAMKALEGKEQRAIKMKIEAEKNLQACQKEKSDVQSRIKVVEKELNEAEHQLTEEEKQKVILQDEIDDKLVRVITLEKELKEILELTSKRNEGENIANANRLQLVQSFADLTVNYVEGSMISVSVIGESNDEHGDPERIEVVLSFCDSTHQNLTGVKIYSDKCSWDDLIKAAIRDNDSIWLLEAVKKRFKSTYGLLDEITSLQSRYAIDWQPEERLVTVILPGKKQSICVLKLDSSYPSVQKIECLVADDLIKEKIKTKEMGSLTQWLEHLHDNC